MIVLLVNELLSFFSLVLFHFVKKKKREKEIFLGICVINKLLNFYAFIAPSCCIKQFFAENLSFSHFSTTF